MAKLLKIFAELVKIPGTMVVAFVCNEARFLSVNNGMPISCSIFFLLIFAFFIIEFCSFIKEDIFCEINSIEKKIGMAIKIRDAKMNNKAVSVLFHFFMMVRLKYLSLSRMYRVIAPKNPGKKMYNCLNKRIASKTITNSKRICRNR